METNILDTDTSANSGISNTTGVYDDSDAPTPIFTINPTPEMEPNDVHGDKNDDDDEYY